MEAEGDTPNQGDYQVESILDSRERRYGWGKVTEYLVKWKDYGPEFNSWKADGQLESPAEKIEAYKKNQRPESSDTCS